MDEQGALRLECEFRRDGARLVHIAFAQGQLQRVAVHRYAQETHQPGVAQRFRKIVGPCHQAAGARHVLPRHEAGMAPRAQGLDDGQRPRAAAVHLQGQVELARPRLAIELGQGLRPRALLREFRDAGKGHEFVDVGLEALHERPGIFQPDQRDAGVRAVAAQGPQRRYRAQHVAQLQGAEHRDAARRGMPECVHHGNPAR
ncbi:hypothetical protein BAU08_21520 [Bordetella bronchialis]|uniref:Uncharacterized protein n=1 Tax=Bordetella bronchialis TaxID=463025 RepID=A0A193G0Q7_9BORD|nr:hypothetical protein BAU08_21520 [Bordetella bronchialis]